MPKPVHIPTWEEEQEALKHKKKIEHIPTWEEEQAAIEASKPKIDKEIKNPVTIVNYDNIQPATKEVPILEPTDFGTLGGDVAAKVADVITEPQTKTSEGKPLLPDIGWKDIVRPAFNAGTTLLSQFNRPYSGASQAAESLIKTVTTPATPEEVQIQSYPVRLISKLLETGANTVKGGWRGFWDNTKGATDPIKAAVAAIRGPGSKISGDPGISGYAKDILSAQGLEELRPVTDVAAAFTSLDPLTNIKSFLPASIRPLGETVIKERGQLPGTVLEQIASGQRGYAAREAGGLSEKLADVVNLVPQYGAKGLLKAGESVDNMPYGGWGDILKGAKDVYNKGTRALSSAIYNRTGDPLEDLITESGLKVKDRAKAILEEEASKWRKSKEGVLMGTSAPDSPEAARKALAEGYQLSGYPLNFKKSSLTPKERKIIKEGMDSGIYYDYNELIRNKHKVMKDRLNKALKNEDIDQFEYNDLMESLDKYVGDAAEGSMNVVESSAQVDRSILDEIQSRTGAADNERIVRPLDFLVSSRTNRPLTPEEIKIIQGLDIVPKDNVQGMYINPVTGDLMEHRAYDSPAQAKANPDEAKMPKKDAIINRGTPDINSVREMIVNKLARTLSGTRQTMAAMTDPTIKKMYDSLSDSMRGIKNIQTENKVRNLLVGDHNADLYDLIGASEMGTSFKPGSVIDTEQQTLFKKLLNKMNLYGDLGDLPPDLAQATLPIQKKSVEDITRMFDPEAKKILETQTGGELTSNNQKYMNKFLINRNSTEGLSGVYTSKSGADLPVGYVNAVNKYKDKINPVFAVLDTTNNIEDIPVEIAESIRRSDPHGWGILDEDVVRAWKKTYYNENIPAIIRHNTEVLNLEDDLGPLAETLLQNFGSYSGKVFDTDPIRGMSDKLVKYAKNAAADEFYQTINKLAQDNSMAKALGDTASDTRLLRIMGSDEVPEGYIRSQSPELKNVIGTPEIIKRIDDQAGKVNKPSDEQPLYDLFNTMMGAWKKGVTTGAGIPRFGFSFTNFLGEAGKNYQQGVTSTSPYIKAFKAKAAGTDYVGPKPDNFIELKEQPGFIKSSIPNGQTIYAVDPKAGGAADYTNKSRQFLASDILKMAKEDGVIGQGFLSADVGEIIKESPDLGKLVINTTDKMSGQNAMNDLIKLQKRAMAETNPQVQAQLLQQLSEAQKSIESSGVNKFGAEILDFVKRNKTLPPIISSDNFKLLPPELQKFYGTKELIKGKLTSPREMAEQAGTNLWQDPRSRGIFEELFEAKSKALAEQPVRGESGLQIVELKQPVGELSIMNNPAELENLVTKAFPNMTKGKLTQTTVGVAPTKPATRWEQFLEFAGSPIKKTGEYFSEIGSATKKPLNAEETKAMREQLKTFGGRMKAAVTNLRATDKKLSAKAVGGVLRGLSAFGESGQTLGKYSEDMARLANYIDKLDKGWTREAAKKMVEATSFNYADRSDLLEKARMIFPFATYPWKNVPLQVKLVLEDMKFPASTSRAIAGLNAEPSTQEELKNAPDYFKAGAPVRVPPPGRSTTDALAGENKSSYINLERYLPMMQVLGKDLPWEDRGAGIIEGLLSSMSPAIKLPIEIATNKTFPSGAPIDKLLTKGSGNVYQENVQGLLGETPKLADYFLRNAIPPYGEASRLFVDEKKSGPERLLKLLTGFGTANLDTQRGEVSKAKQPVRDINQLKSELKRAILDGNQYKVDQIIKLLEDENFVESLLK